MTELTAFTVFVLPVGLGLLGFIEPCSIGSTLVFVKYLEGRDRAGKIAQVSVVTLARAIFTGALGAAAVALGTVFLGFQKAGWILLGAAATGGVTGLTFAAGFASLALFGLALSAPLVAAVLFEPVRRWLDRLAALSRRIPFWTGLLLLLLGLWSIRFAFVAEIGA